MDIRMRLFCMGAALTLVTPVAHADWTGQGEAGFVMARGNTETDTANVKLDLATGHDKWKHAFGFAALYGKSNEIKSAERFDTRWQSDYKLTSRMFVFGALRYERDRFSGFEYQATLSGGLGYNFIDNDKTQLTGTLGAGYRTLRTETLVKDSLGNVIDRMTGEKSNDLVASAGVNFSHALTANTKITDKLLVESGSDNTFTQNDLALQVSMSEKLALSVGYGVRHNSDPPAGLKKTDQLTTLNLVYKIK